MDNTKKSRVTTFRMWDHLKEDFQRIAEAEDRYYSKSDHINRAIEDYIKKQQGRLLRYGSESPKHNTK